MADVAFRKDYPRALLNEFSIDFTPLFHHLPAGGENKGKDAWQALKKARLIPPGNFHDRGFWLDWQGGKTGAPRRAHGGRIGKLVGVRFGF